MIAETGQRLDRVVYPINLFGVVEGLASLLALSKGEPAVGIFAAIVRRFFIVVAVVFFRFRSFFPIVVFLVLVVLLLAAIAAFPRRGLEFVGNGVHEQALDLHIVGIVAVQPTDGCPRLLRGLHRHGARVGHGTEQNRAVLVQVQSLDVPCAGALVDGRTARGDVVPDRPFLIGAEELHVLVRITATRGVEVEAGLHAQRARVCWPRFAIRKCLGQIRIAGSKFLDLFGTRNRVGDVVVPHALGSARRQGLLKRTRHDDVVHVVLESGHRDDCCHDALIVVVFDTTDRDGLVLQVAHVGHTFFRFGNHVTGLACQLFPLCNFVAIFLADLVTTLVLRGPRPLGLHAVTVFFRSAKTTAFQGMTQALRREQPRRTRDALMRCGLSVGQHLPHSACSVGHVVAAVAALLGLFEKDCRRFEMPAFDELAKRLEHGGVFRLRIPWWL